MNFSDKTTLLSLQQKIEELEIFFRNKIIVVAFSGGVDSTVVAELSHRFALRSVAVTADSPTMLPGEVNETIQIAKDRGWEHRVISINELDQENFRANPINRCYYCKTGLSAELHKIAKEINADLIVEGTNVSEASEHRPGLQALKENEIKSPLLLHQIAKSEIRDLARFLGLPNADKPSLACLSSRFPYGTRITPEKLQRVGLAERYILDTYEIKTLRVRDHDGLARIEVAPDERAKLLSIEILDDLHKKLKDLGFSYVTIDCVGYRTGALNEVIDKSILKKSIITSLPVKTE
ncbi:MAG: ATP-dependent sacrificial sulfur transferase LarE [Candidatus Hodarchaeales archaeon]|jgi:uncharacterized protein